MARSRWWALLYGLAAAAVALLGCRGKIGITSDSVFSMSSAECLASGRGFCTEISAATAPGPTEPAADYPPGYPLLCSWFLVAGSTPDRAVCLATVVSFGVGVALTFLFARGCCKLAWTPHALAALAIGFRPHLLLALSAWSDMTFWALSIASLWVVATWIENEHAGLGRLAAAGVLTAATALTRFLGVVAFLAGLAGIHQRTKRSDRPRVSWIAPALVYGLTTCAPVLLLLVRNMMVSRTATGPRPMPGLTLAVNVRLAVSASASDLAPMRAAEWGQGMGQALWLFWVVVAAATLVRKGFWAGVRRRVQGAPRLQLSLVYSISYVYILVCLSTIVDFHAIGTVLLGPMYVFLGFPAAACVEQWLEPEHVRSRRRLRRAGMFLLAVWCAGHLAKTAPLLLHVRDSYYGRWERSPVHLWLRQNVRDGEAIYSSSPQITWLFTRLPVKFGPTHERDLQVVLARLRALPSSASAYVVLYPDERTGDSGFIDTLASTPGMTPALRCDDVAVYAWRPK